MDALIPMAKQVPREALMHTPWPVLGCLNELCEEVVRLRGRIEQLEARLQQDSTNSHKPPSTDSPFKTKSDPSPARPKAKRRELGRTNPFPASDMPAARLVYLPRAGQRDGIVLFGKAS